MKALSTNLPADFSETAKSTWGALITQLENSSVVSADYSKLIGYIS
jgi:hypothetical protein